MPIQQMLLGAGGAAPVKVQDVFSADLWTGNGSSQSIDNDIKLSSEGGLVWAKNRQTNIGGVSHMGHILTDTVRGTSKFLRCHGTSTEETSNSMVTSFNADGYTLGSDSNINYNTDTYVGWTFRKHPKFFDIQTATVSAGGASTMTHSLECDCGMAIFKSLNNTTQGANWIVWHKEGCTGANEFWRLNTNDGRQSQSNTVNYNSSTKTFTFGYPASVMADRLRPGTGASSNVIGYFFADNTNNGGFGSGGDEDIIRTGTYTGNGNTAGPSAVNVGFEPQYLIVKRLNAAADWIVWDTARGVVSGEWSNYTYTEPHLKLNQNYSENWPVGTDMMEFNSSGFQPRSNDIAVNNGGHTYIYLAIRKDQS
tara:strand:- start:327 stop:1424 length:1098 start_codon:yes stop_codon:yes gene_type:complete